MIHANDSSYAKRIKFDTFPEIDSTVGHSYNMPVAFLADEWDTLPHQKQKNMTLNCIQY